MNHQFFPDPLGTSHFAKKPGRGQSGPGEKLVKQLIYPAIKMVIFHSYVSLPEGNVEYLCVYVDVDVDIAMYTHNGIIFISPEWQNKHFEMCGMVS